MSLEDKLSIFPNPVAKQLHIRAACCTLKDAGISIYNMMGQRVYHNIVTGDTVIEVENLAPGSYVVEVKAGQESLRKLISVQ